MPPSPSLSLEQRRTARCLRILDKEQRRASKSNPKRAMTSSGHHHEYVPFISSYSGFGRQHPGRFCVSWRSVPRPQHRQQQKQSATAPVVVRPPVLSFSSPALAEIRRRNGGPWPSFSSGVPPSPAAQNNRSPVPSVVGQIHTRNHTEQNTEKKRRKNKSQNTIMNQR